MSARTGPEAAFQDQVVEIAQLYRWRVAHFRPAQTTKGWRTPVSADGKGFPDLIMTRPRELIVAELKTAVGRLSPDQQAWVADLSTVADAVGTAARGDIWGTEVAVEVYVWRPADFDEIQARLARPVLRSAA